jgi:transcription elongation factor GreA-like protein
MAYLEEFKAQINNRDVSRILQLWEEYCTSDEVDGKELVGILKALKGSDFATTFGQYIELALPLWKGVEDDTIAFEVLTLILDLQTTNSEQLALFKSSKNGLVTTPILMTNCAL